MKFHHLEPPEIITFRGHKSLIFCHNSQPYTTLIGVFFHYLLL